MNISPGMQQSGLQGVRNSLKELQQAAQQIADNTAGSSRDSADLAEAVIALKQAEIEGKAAVKVGEAEANMLGSLLDTSA